MNCNFDSFDELLKLSPQDLHVDSGVGTLSEKYLHALLKNFYEQDKSCHEVTVGRFTADICKENSIIEIQTRSLNRLRDKLEYYIESGYKVKVVYPIPRHKWLVWVDNETGDMTKRRKSPKIGSIYSSIPELYKIKYFLDWKNFEIDLLFYDAEEYRNLDGYGKDKKFRSTRLEMIPLCLCEIVSISNLVDWKRFLPSDLPIFFKSSDLAKSAEITKSYASTLLNILSYLGVVKKCGKDGKSYLYEISDI